ncbi:hypothetical protein Lal_00004378 [Lupinus albus]|uniref:Uncharacterized protein n=1 Tax=Lupinus albus TaxID=3870 RepID=A0A6A5M1Z2_LUPAL|nr:hypothetical protein Lalb_Chr23g0273171 [Lupinus albus]KAF1865005.1 hypothetical protein Lal_00004378 [Lupinus albus]
MSNSDPINIDSTTNIEERSNTLLPNTKRTFCFPCCFGSRHSPSTGFTWWERVRITSWWKTFIRRFNRNRSNGLRNNGKYQYDPLSYALNFDEGLEDDGHDRFRNFSTRYDVATTIKSGSTDAGKDVVVFSVEREGNSDCAE